MTTFLMIYSTTDGHTLEICQSVQRVLAAHGHAVRLTAIEEAAAVEPAAFDRIVIGASIRYGRHNPLIVAFIKRHAALLEARSSAFFSVNLVARKPEKRQPDSNPYVRKFLRRIPWRPQTVAVFAGKLDYPRYRALDRMAIRLIMWMTGGPTDPATVADFTDWRQVEAFAETLAAGVVG